MNEHRGTSGRRHVAAMLAAVATVAAGVLPLAGCGGTVQVGPARRLVITLSEYRLRPDSVQMSSGPVTLVVRNLGRLTHDLVIADGTDWMGDTGPMWPGQTEVLRLVLTPGTYSMYSSLLSDQALGAYGTFEVTS